MTRVVGRIGGLVVVVLGLAAGEAAAQGPVGAPSGAPERRLSIEGAAGLQLSYRGSIQSVAFGFAPTRNLTLLVSAERSHVRDEIDQYPDGYGFERGGTEVFVSGQVRYAFFVRKRVSPYVLGGAGRGISRPNVNEFFPDKRERNIHVLYWGGGVRIPVQARLDAFVDARIIMEAEARTDYFGVRLPVRAGLAWRF